MKEVGLLCGKSRPVVGVCFASALPRSPAVACYRMPFILPRSLWPLVLLTLAVCAAWAFVAPNALLTFFALLSAFGTYAMVLRAWVDQRREVRVRRR